jgi:hypothetical protein
MQILVESLQGEVNSVFIFASDHGLDFLECPTDYDAHIMISATAEGVGKQYFPLAMLEIAQLQPSLSTYTRLCHRVQENKRKCSRKAMWIQTIWFTRDDPILGSNTFSLHRKLRKKKKVPQGILTFKSDIYLSLTSILDEDTRRI